MVKSFEEYEQEEEAADDDEPRIVDAKLKTLILDKLSAIEKKLSDFEPTFVTPWSSKVVTKWEMPLEALEKAVTNSLERFWEDDDDAEINNRMVDEISAAVSADMMDTIDETVSRIVLKSINQINPTIKRLNTELMTSRFWMRFWIACSIALSMVMVAVNFKGV